MSDSQLTYATLVVARTRVEGRQVGDTFVAEDGLNDYYQQHVRAHHSAEHDRLSRRFQESREEFQQSLRIEQGDRQRRRMGIGFAAVAPDGARYPAPTEAAAVGYALADWDKVHRPPKGLTAHDLNDWKAGLSHQSQRSWTAELVDGDGRCEPHDLGAAEWSWWGAPVAATNRLLNRLSGEGWSLVHISEDRGLYQGVDATDESSPTRIRYLMRREGRGGRQHL